MTDSLPDWKQRDRDLARRADRAFMPSDVPGAPGLIFLPSRAAYRLDAVGTRRRLVPKVRSKKERRRLRAELKRAQEAVQAQADSAIARGGDSPCPA